MKSKLFRVMVVLMILATLTLTNFIYVGVGAISYAASANDTNHKNVEFTANLKDEKTLTLGVNVKNEGYFNGEVSLENNNFKMKSSSSEYVNKVEENKITLNQINAGTNVQIDARNFSISSTVEMPPAALTLQRPATPLTISSTSWKFAPAVEKPVLVLM